MFFVLGTEVEFISYMKSRWLLLFLFAPSVFADPLAAELTPKQECDRRAQEFRQQLRTGIGNQRDGIFYSTPQKSADDRTSYGLQQHFCHAFNGVECRAGLKLDIDLAQQKLVVTNGNKQLSIMDFSMGEEDPSNTSTGRLLPFKRSNGSSGYADTPVGNYTVRFSQTEAYRCSGAFEGAGMPFAIPIGNDGHFIHGLDGSFKKSKHLGTPASGGCVRVLDQTACQLYATLKKCSDRSATIVVKGQWPNQVYAASGRLVDQQAGPPTRRRPAAR